MKPTGMPRNPPPTTCFLPGTGVLSSRTGWGKGDTQVLFRAGPTRESHDDRAQGAVLLSRDNQWLVGTAKLQSHSGIDQSAIDWTTLSVDGKEQTWTQDGAKIIRQEDTPQYTYAIADLSAAYNNLLSVFIREILFLKSGFVLIADGYVPVNAGSLVTFHLNTPNPPQLTGVSFQAGQLFGTVIEPTIRALTSQTVKLDPNQPIPTYRIDVAGDTTGHFLVALEAGAANQSMATLGQVVNLPAVQGVRCGQAFVGWLSGGQNAWTYPSPASGLHYLIGTPNTPYQTPGGPLTSSACGVLTLAAQPAGQTVTITKGGTPPPPPPPPPIGKTYTLSGTVTSQSDGSLLGMIKLEPQP